MTVAHERTAFELTLYTTGATPRSTRAVRNMVRFCNKHLAGRYRLHVVDLYERPELAAAAQVVAAPTLVKLQPSPVRRIIGDMSDEARIGQVLGVALEILP